MANIYGNRHDETFEYVRVAWSNKQEHETYNHIVSGSVEMSTESELKVTGSFEFEGYDLPNVNDLIRIYYSFRDDNNLLFREPIATFIPSYADIELVDTNNGVKASGTLQGNSVLSVLKNEVVGQPYTVPKNCNPVYEAGLIIQEHRLEINAEPSSFSLTQNHTFDGGTSYLEIVNWLLSSASFREAYPDANGIVQLKSIVQKGTDAFLFQNDEKSIMLPELQEQNDWQTTPNRVQLLYNIDDACVVAHATNISGSRASYSERGNRYIDYYEEISDLGTGNKQNNLKTMAEDILREKSCDVEFVTFKHAYVPIMIYDSVSINYDDYSWTGNVETMRVDLSVATETETRIKRTLYQEIKIKSEARVLR